MARIKIGAEVPGKPTEKQIDYYRWLYQEEYGCEPDEDLVEKMTFTEISHEISRLVTLLEVDEYATLDKSMRAFIGSEMIKAARFSPQYDADLSETDAQFMGFRTIEDDPF